MTREPYVPPAGDEPLDAVEQALVRMWADIVVRSIRARLAAAAAAQTAEKQHPERA